MNGRKLKYKQAVGQSAASCVFIVPAGSTLNLNNGTIENVNNTSGSNTYYIAGAIVNDGTVSLNTVTISISVSNTSFTSNKATTSGGAVYSQGVMTFNHISFKKNQAQNINGGAIYVTSSGNVAINDKDGNGNEFDENLSPLNGGGIYTSGVLSMKGVTATNNIAYTGGFLYIDESGSATVDSTSISENMSEGNGAAIYSNGTLAVNGKISISGNTSAGGVANNVYLAKDKIITVNGSLKESNICVSLEGTEGVFTSGFGSNNSDTDPSTIFTPDYYPEFYGITLADNEAKLAMQSPIITNEESVLRKALDMFDNFSIKLSDNITLSNSTLEIPGNKTVTIDLGGFTLDRGIKSGAWYTGGQAITVREGATLNLSNGTLTGGYGGDGGAIQNSGTANLTNVNITDNRVEQRGGAIANHGTLNMTGGSITNNYSNDTEGSAGGGAIFAHSGSNTTLSGVTITGNEAKVAGGGAVNNWGTLTIDGCTITGNTAKQPGGAIWTAEAQHSTCRVRTPLPITQERVLRIMFT